jgi:hypothetical protein
MVLRQLTLYELGCRLDYQGPRYSLAPEEGSDKFVTGKNTTTDNSITDNTTTETLRILQLNTAGIHPKMVELAKLLSELKIHVALIQKNNAAPGGFIQYYQLHYTQIQMSEVSRNSLNNPK